MAVMAIMFTGKASGLIRDVLTKRQFGTGNALSEAFNYASQFPRVFLEVFFASAFTASFIPVFCAYLEDKGKDAAYRMAGNFITLTLVLTAAASALLMAGAGGIMDLYLMASADAAFKAEVKALAVPLMRIMLPTIVLSGAAYCVTGVLQALNEFKAPAAMSLASNLIIVAYFVFFYERFGVYGLAAVFVIGWGAQIGVQIPALRRKGFGFKLGLNLKEPALKEVWKQMLPVMAAAAAVPVNFLVNTAVVGAEAGGAALDTANSIYSVVTGVFVLSVSNVLFTRFSQLGVAGRKDDFNAAVTGSVRNTLFFLLPMSAGVFALSPGIVYLAFQWGAFTEQSTAVTSGALRFFSLGMAGFGLYNVLGRSFYAVRDSRRPLVASVIAVAVNAALSWVLTGVLGTAGTALASSSAMTAAGLYLFAALVKKKVVKADGAYAVDLAKMLFLSGTMAVVAMQCYDLIAQFSGGKLGAAFALSGAIVVGAAWYLGGTYLMRVNEARRGAAYIKMTVKKKGGETA